MNGINYATVLRLNSALLSLILVKFFVLSRYKLLGAIFFFEIMSDCFEFEKNPDIIRKMCTSKFHIASSYFFGKKAGRSGLGCLGLLGRPAYRLGPTGMQTER